MTGPTAGDLIELADTGLVIRVEADAERAGDEFRTGFGKTARDGMHLAVTAGAAVRFEPGGTRRVALVPVGGRRVVIGFAGLVDGPLDEPGARERALEKARACGYEDAGPSSTEDAS